MGHRITDRVKEDVSNLGEQQQESCFGWAFDPSSPQCQQCDLALLCRLVDRGHVSVERAQEIVGGLLEKASGKEAESLSALQGWIEKLLSYCRAHNSFLTEWDDFVQEQAVEQRKKVRGKKSWPEHIKNLQSLLPMDVVLHLRRRRDGKGYHVKFERVFPKKFKVVEENGLFTLTVGRKKYQGLDYRALRKILGKEGIV